MVSKTPDFTLVVSLHDDGLIVAVVSEVADISISASDHKVSVEVVHSTDGITKLNASSHGEVGWINKVDGTVSSSSSDKLVISKVNGADEALMDFLRLLAHSTYKSIDSSISTTTESVSFSIPSDRGDRRHGVSVENTLLLFSGLGIPEVDMLGSSSSESG